MSENFNAKHLIWGGVIAIISSVATSFVNHWLTNWRMDFQASVNTQRLILEKRMDLYERMARIYGKAPGFKSLWESHIELAGVYEDGNPKPSTTKYSKEIDAIHSEYYTVTILAKSLFGFRTAKAIVDYETYSGNRGWWEGEPKKMKNILHAMALDMSFANESLRSMEYSLPRAKVEKCINEDKQHNKRVNLTP